MLTRFSCELCEYKATQKGNLLRHIKSTHEGVKFPCEQCEYKAKYKGNLLKHIKSTHEGVKFPCEQCDYKAKWKKGLLRHIKSIHEGVKFPCEQCDYKATQSLSIFSTDDDDLVLTRVRHSCCGNTKGTFIDTYKISP